MKHPSTGRILLGLATAGLAALILVSPESLAFGAKPTKAKTPVLTSLSVDSGPYSGGTTITLKGKNFTKSSKVRFDTGPAKSVRYVSKTTLVVTSPPRDNYGWYSGEASIRVWNGTKHSGARDFTYVDLTPELTSVASKSASHGAEKVDTHGGSAVHLVGVNFDGPTSVTFDGVAAMSFTASADGYAIDAIAPAHATGWAQVVVTNAYGSSQPREIYYDDPKIDVAANPTALGPTAISGTVVTTTYQYVQSVGVELYSVDAAGASHFMRATTTAAQGNTLGGLTSGHYTFTGLMPGKYRVCFSGEEGILTKATPIYGFADQCSGGVAWNGRESEVPSNALVVDVAAQLTTTVDAYLSAAALISGHVSGAAMTNVNGAVAWLYRNGVAVDYAVSDDYGQGSGNFTFSGIGAGSYQVCFDTSFVTADAFAPNGYQSSCAGAVSWTPGLPPPPSAQTQSVAPASLWAFTVVLAAVGS